MVDGSGSFDASEAGLVGEEPEVDALSARAHPTLRRRVVEAMALLLAAALFAFAIRTFAIESFYVPSGSMTPSLLTGDRILVDKLPWVRHDIHRGDIVVFRRVPKDPQTEDADLVKRVIGLPGETISSKGDTIYINGKPIRQPWLPNLSQAYSEPGHQACAQRAYDIPTTHIPKGQIFVMGDCRAISYDSRFWGTVPISYVVGKVQLVIWRNNHPWFHWF